MNRKESKNTVINKVTSDETLVAIDKFSYNLADPYDNPQVDAEQLMQELEIEMHRDE